MIRKFVSIILFIVIIFFICYNLNSKFFKKIIIRKKLTVKKTNHPEKPKSPKKSFTTTDYITGNYHYKIYKKVKKKINQANKKHSSEIEKMLNE